jgi:hypothetical protein
MTHDHCCLRASWPGLSRPSTPFLQLTSKTSMPGTSPGPTNESSSHEVVMRGLDPRIHPLPKKILSERWIAGSSPAMTNFRSGTFR